MPKTNRTKPARKNFRIPVPLVDEIDKILKKFPMYGSRQRFIETAIQEKIEEVKQLGETNYQAIQISLTSCTAKP
jgi:metal-responsive CopG/Arc/MetJ family transcriptional regulator